MTSIGQEPSSRGRFDGVIQIIRFNWPRYAVATFGLLAATWWLTEKPDSFPAVRLCAWVGGFLCAWWSVASLAASHWIYDRSPLYRWAWIPDVLPEPPLRWLNLHAGLDESSPALQRLFPLSQGTAGDFYDQAEVTEASIHRARARQAELPPSVSVNPLKLPYPDQAFDTVFLLFAAHELRNAACREGFMNEIRRVLAPNGRVLLVEHDRGFANFAAFGPGFLHFLPAGEWRRLAATARMSIELERRMTPFVQIIQLRKSP